MKATIVSLAVLFLVNLIPALTFGVEQGQPEPAPTAAQPREQYEKSMQERLGRLGRQLDELKASAAGKAEQAREEMNQLVAEAEKKQEAASRKLEEMRKASKQKWGEFTSQVNQAADDFERAYEKAKSRFKE